MVEEGFSNLGVMHLLCQRRDSVVVKCHHLNTVVTDNEVEVEGHKDRCQTANQSLLVLVSLEVQIGGSCFHHFVLLAGELNKFFDQI